MLDFGLLLLMAASVAGAVVGSVLLVWFAVWLRTRLLLRRGQRDADRAAGAETRKLPIIRREEGEGR